MLRALANVLVVIAVAGATACGGEEGTSKEEYEQTIAGTRENVDSILGDLTGGAEEVKSSEDIRRLVGEAQDGLLDEANELDGMDPPEEVQGEHDELVSALQELADQDLEDIDRLAEGELGADEIDEVKRRLANPDFASLKQLERAFQGIEEKGYDVGGGK